MARKYLILLISFLLLMSCSDIFSTRDPEDPNSDGDVYISESVNELVTNLKTSLLTLDKNAYESLLIDPLTTDWSYSFETNSEDISDPSIFVDWGIDNEKLFIDEIKISGSAFSDISLSLNDTYNETLNSLNIELDYSMSFTDTSSTVFTVKGVFTFEIIKIDGHFWYIEKWIDQYYDLSIDQLSFSKLKEPYIY
ncbi:MAG: hypothetical protein PF574_07695 [Candidatus Delongbacteria bacterium]|jgi:hypothetical protein|nr:hypothetical protein [Candidatus Delongbacteria bacterium]